MKPQSFVEQCLAGSVGPGQIDDFVDQWHTDEAAQSMELRDFLGMSKVEYAAWMQDSNALHGILVSRGYISCDLQEGKQ
jgi:hypothetical protein